MLVEGHLRRLHEWHSPLFVGRSKKYAGEKLISITKQMMSMTIRAAAIKAVVVDPTGQKYGRIRRIEELREIVRERERYLNPITVTRSQAVIKEIENSGQRWTKSRDR